MLSVMSVVLLSAVQASPAPAPSAKPEEKLVCKRFVETGSLVKGKRECKTERQWQDERNEARQRGDSVTGCASGQTGARCF